MNLWMRRNFRVWRKQIGAKPVLEDWASCDKLEPFRVTLSGPMPQSAWLTDDMVLEAIELHHDTCGNPREYRPERIMFRCTALELLHWSIEPVSIWDSSDDGTVVLTVELGCETESLYKQAAL